MGLERRHNYCGGLASGALNRRARAVQGNSQGGRANWAPSEGVPSSLPCPGGRPGARGRVRGAQGWGAEDVTTPPLEQVPQLQVPPQQSLFLEQDCPGFLQLLGQEVVASAGGEEHRGASATARQGQSCGAGAKVRGFRCALGMRPPALS